METNNKERSHTAVNQIYVPFSSTPEMLTVDEFRELYPDILSQIDLPDTELDNIAIYDHDMNYPIVSVQKLTEGFYVKTFNLIVTSIIHMVPGVYVSFHARDNFMLPAFVAYLFDDSDKILRVLRINDHHVIRG